MPLGGEQEVDYEERERCTRSRVQAKIDSRLNALESFSKPLARLFVEAQSFQRNVLNKKSKQD